MASSTADLLHLINRVSIGTTEAPDSPNRTRILDAVVAELTVTSVRKLAVEDVARRAGVSRVTVYRHFGDRDGLLATATARELSRVLEAVTSADDVEASATDRVASAFVTAWQASRAHPVIGHWLATDPGGVLDLVLAEDSQVLRLGAVYLTAAIRNLAGDQGAPDPDATAELLVRIFLALLLMPPPSLHPDDPESARRLARSLIAPIVVNSSG